MTQPPKKVIRWETPPGRDPVNKITPEFVSELEDNPGRWALVRRAQSRSGAYSIAQRWKRVYGPRGFSFCCRRDKDGTTRIYGRYRVEKDEDDE